MIALSFTRARSQHLKGSQKLFGVIAVVCGVLILLQPEFFALGLFGDTAFFDILVLALTLQMHSYALQAIHMFVTALSRCVRWLGIPSPGLSYIVAVLTGSIAGGIAMIRGQRTVSSN